ncbi:MAG: spore germination protein [Alkaliphilus sp.]|nr:spore germination protein [bacterium AH-315-G05]MBN4074334.1 spore germination protein [bacterium AH-315-E09]PHS36099.1 MAG: spore germination protein [Alkaliphilus sp.]
MAQNSNDKTNNNRMNKNLETNIETFKEILKDCKDIVYRKIEIGKDIKLNAAIIYLDGMIDRNLVNEYVLTHLMLTCRMTEPNPKNRKGQFVEQIKKNVLAVSDMKEVETIDDGILNILSGETVLLLDDYEKIIIIGSRGWPMRSVSEPITESVIRGPRDGFTETLRVNTALIRRRIRDSQLKVHAMQVGRRSRTDVAILYIEDIADSGLVEEVKKRLEEIDVEAVIDSGFLEQLIEDNWISIFPQIQNTERADVASAALYEGKTVIVVDNSPFVLIAPSTFNAMMQSAEDYHERWMIATVVRILRYFAAFLSLLFPALYVAITSFHPQMLPTSLVITLSANRSGVPFPAIIEALLMEVTIELLREAGVRLPGPIGATIGIVGGLVIGQAAVEAGLVAPLMVIVVAVTAIASFSIPSYNIAIAFRMLRFIFIVSAGFLGLYGIMLILTAVLVHLCSLKSFNTPFLSPFVTVAENTSALKDTIVRAPTKFMKR